MAQEDADQSAASIGTSALLDGLEGEARRDRAELVAWLMRRGFTADEIAASVTPMLLPANRVMGDDGVYVSTREMVHATGIDLELLQGMQRAAGLPRIDDPDAAVLPRADVEVATRAKYLLDFGVDPDDMLAIVRVFAEGLRRGAAMMREPTFKAFAKPGASEVDVAESADALAQAVIPSLKRMVEGLLMLQVRHMFEGQGITAAERATGRLPGARQVAVAFADLAGFTRLGEMVPPEDLQRVAGRLGELAHDVAVPPVSFVKTIGDAVMFVSTDTDRLIAALLDLIDLAAATTYRNYVLAWRRGSPSAVRGTGTAARSTSPAASPASHAPARSWLRLLHARRSARLRDSSGRPQGRNICAACLAVCGCIACPARHIRRLKRRAAALGADWTPKAESDKGSSL